MIHIKEYVEEKERLLTELVNDFDEKPVLAIIQVGNNAASNTYVKHKKSDCKKIGIECQHHHFEENVTQEYLEEFLIKLNDDKKVNGIIIQLPLPSHLDVKMLQACVSPIKDVDGFRKDSPFTPCTPKGIIDWLDINEYSFKGKNIVVVGRSEIVGKPLVNLLIDRGATVTCCNSKTNQVTLYWHLQNADMVISAIGQPKYFNSDDFLKATIVIDVGINRDENGKLCGDIDPEFFSEDLPMTYLTPVPGGVGRLTRVSLLENVMVAYTIQNEIEFEF